MTFDYIIVGAGITGITAAEELSNVLNKKVLLIDKRDHIGGNCYDYKSEEGTFIHKYGPHIFHTDNTHVYNYLSLFTRWDRYSHKILYDYDGTLIPVPFNFISIDKCLPSDAEHIKINLLNKYEINEEIPIKELKESDDKYIRKLGEYIYNVFSKNLMKTYRIDREEVSELTDEMFPFRMSYDCRFYKNVYQVEPTHGYTDMFNNMLSNHNITVLLNKDYHEIINIDHENKKIYYEKEEFKGHLIFTGMIDEFFDYKFGELEYNSFVYDEELIQNSTFQDNSIIYYPDKSSHFSRIIDYKYISREFLPTTYIQFEYPSKYDKNDFEMNIPYYPVDLSRNIKIYEEYKKLSEEYDNITFIGRLAEYKNLQMDECVEEVLKLMKDKFIGL